MSIDQPNILESWELESSHVSAPQNAQQVLAHTLSLPLDGLDLMALQQSFSRIRGRDEATKLAAATSTDISLEVSLLLARYGSSQVKCALARNPAIDPDILDNLAKYPDLAVRLAVAQSHNLTDIARMLLAQDPDRRVRVAICENETTPVWLVMKLARDTIIDKGIEKAEGSIFESPLIKLKKICRTNETKEAFRLARKETCSTRELSVMGAIGSRTVKRWVIFNKNTLQETLAELKENDLDPITQEAFARLKLVDSGQISL